MKKNILRVFLFLIISIVSFSASFSISDLDVEAKLQKDGWIIGHTDRFKCAASQRSISNWISKFGTTDIGYYFNADQNQATPWINHDKLWWHSPLKYADKAKTPTLFIHSEEDYRCWLAEGLQMFTALKYHGIEARLCMFRGENHELSRSGKPKHRIRRLTEITNWFEKYLK